MISKPTRVAFWRLPRPYAARVVRPWSCRAIPLSKKKTQLQLRKERQAHVLANVQAALARDNKLKNENRVPKRRRKVATELADYLGLPLTDRRRIRDAESFRTRTYSLAGQVEELVAHMFTKYPAPRFLLHAMLSPKGRALVLGETRGPGEPVRNRAGTKRDRVLFLAAAQGKSVAKMLAPELTARETHWFLKGPDRFTSAENVCWAKLVAGGVPQSLATRLTSRLMAENHWAHLGARQGEFIRMFASFPASVPQGVLTEVIDFSVTMTTVAGFRFQGRTIGSMRKLARQWHRENRFGARGELVCWTRRFEPWEYVTLTEHVRVVELSTSWRLHEESMRQRHCVFTYLESCKSGYTRIVSFQWFHKMPAGALVERRRVTASVDVRDKLVDQALGRCNRSLDFDERAVVKKWAAAQGLTIADWIWW